MNKAEWKALADLLDMADEEFSNHGCNDYELDNTPDNRKLVEDAERYLMEDDFDGISISDDGIKIYTEDSILMGYFAHIAEENSKA